MSDKEKLIEKLSDSIKETSHIDNELFVQYNVKRGLRNSDHTGVLVGLTKIGSVIGYIKNDDGSLEPVDGNLFYRGINVKEIVSGVQAAGYQGFDETVYLLLSGNLPTKHELDTFSKYLADHRDLPQEFTKDIILSLKGKDLMNMLSRAVMGLYVFDDDADSIESLNLMQQSLNLVAKFPTIIAYSYQSMMHGYYHKTLSIRHPKKELTTAENFLYMLKGPGNYTKLDAEILDLSLILHAEHGGGNNSSFTIRVTSSSGTDTYSAVTAAIGSLKGPLHGGANIMVQEMMTHLKKEIKNWSDDYEIKNYLMKILKKEAYNKTGKIYGIGHAIYTKSDPRAILLKVKARELAIEKGRLEEFEFYEAIERMAPIAFAEFKGDKANKVLCANVDFYSGLVYDMIGIPEEIYTPLFAMSRIAGWVAHRIEELNFDSKRIIRPAYRNVYKNADYIAIANR
jgi:citrate synthase